MIAGLIETTARTSSGVASGGIAAQVVSERLNRALVVEDVSTRSAGVQDGVPECQRRAAVEAGVRDAAAVAAAELPLRVLLLIVSVALPEFSPCFGCRRRRGPSCR